MSQQQRSLVVLGAGVIGLTAAYLAATDEELSFKITVVARDMPEDMGSQGWASPWAGANWSPMPYGEEDERIARWEKQTFDKFWDMIPTGLVKFLPSSLYGRRPETDSDGYAKTLWWRDLVKNLHSIPADEIPKSCNIGLGFSTYSVNPSVYLPYLKQELVSRGVAFVKQHVRTIDELLPLTGPEGVLINASSLGSKSLIGVEDQNLFAIRGQTILVQCPGLDQFLQYEIEDHDAGEDATYIIPRPGGAPSDQVILGGVFQVGNWDTSVNMNTAKRVFDSCCTLAPILHSKETRVLSHNVGLRPARQGGPRVEAEWIGIPVTSTHSLLPWTALPENTPEKLLTIHVYGFGPGGYQNSWGACAEAISLLKQHMSQ